MSDMIHQFMNRFKTYKTHGEMAETFHDMIQNNLNRINQVENWFDHMKRSFLHINNTLDNKGS